MGRTTAPGQPRPDAERERDRDRRRRSGQRQGRGRRHAHGNARHVDSARQLTLNADGSFQYIPNAGSTGSDSFTYRASTPLPYEQHRDRDDHGHRNRSHGDGPDTHELRGCSTVPLAAGVHDADGDATTTTLLSGPQHGTLASNADGTYSYTPSSGFTGIDSLTYRALDGLLASNPATVIITVTAAPIATDDLYEVLQGQTLSSVGPLGKAANLLANDVCASGSTRSVVQVATAQHGTLTRTRRHLHLHARRLASPARTASPTASRSVPPSATSRRRQSSSCADNQPPVASGTILTALHDQRLTYTLQAVDPNSFPRAM